MVTDATAILRRTALFRSVPGEDVEAVAVASRRRSFRRGQVVFTAGDRGDTLLVVNSGRLKVAVRSADGGELTLTSIGPGRVAGALSVAHGGHSSADAETLEGCRLLLVPRETIQDLCSRVPSVSQAWTDSLAAALRRLTEAVSDLVYLDMSRRVAKVLLNQPRGDDGVIRLTFTQEELGHQVGSTSQSVITPLGGFERPGGSTCMTGR